MSREGPASPSCAFGETSRGGGPGESERVPRALSEHRESEELGSHSWDLGKTEHTGPDRCMMEQVPRPWLR